MTLVELTVGVESSYLLLRFSCHRCTCELPHTHLLEQLIGPNHVCSPTRGRRVSTWSHCIILPWVSLKIQLHFYWIVIISTLLFMENSLVSPSYTRCPLQMTSFLRTIYWKKSSCLQPDIWMVRSESAGQSDHTVLRSLLIDAWLQNDSLIFLFFFFLFFPPWSIFSLSALH